jgi:hypothetical protein
MTLAKTVRCSRNISPAQFPWNLLPGGVALRSGGRQSEADSQSQQAERLKSKGSQ